MTELEKTNPVYTDDKTALYDKMLNNEGEKINLTKLSYILSDRMALPQKTSYLLIRSLFEIMRNELSKQNTITINGFGTFKTKIYERQKVFVPIKRIYVEKERRFIVKFMSKIKL